MDELCLAHHAADLVDEILVERGRVVNRRVPQAGSRAVRIANVLHHQHVPKVPVRTRDPDLGVREETEDRMLPTGPGRDEASEVPQARDLAELLEGVLRKPSERGVADPVDLDRTELRSLGGTEHAALLADRDRVVERIELALVDESGNGEERRVIEELVEELPVPQLLPPGLDPLTAGKDEVLGLRHAAHGAAARS